MLYIVYFIIQISKNLMQNFPCLTWRGWKTACLCGLCSLCAHQMALNHRQTAIWKLLGVPWLGLHGPSGHYAGPHGRSSACIVTK